MALNKEDTESRALQFVQQSLGAISWSWTGGDSSKSDGFVTFEDGNEIQIEVSSDLPEDLMRAASILERNGDSVSLPEGYGNWRVLISPNPALPRFLEEATTLIDDFLVNQRMIRSGEVWGVDYGFKSFHIVILQRIGDTPNKLTIAATIMSPPDQIFINSNPNSLASYAQNHIDGHIRTSLTASKSSKFQKLIERSHKNRRSAHYALVVTSPIDVGVRLALHGLGAYSSIEIPDTQLSLPGGLDSFWLIRGDYLWGAEFNSQHGWSTHGARR